MDHKNLPGGITSNKEDTIELIDSKDLHKTRTASAKQAEPVFLNKKFLVVNSSSNESSWLEAYFEKIFYSFQASQKYEAKIFLNTRR